MSQVRLRYRCTGNGRLSVALEPRSSSSSTFVGRSRSMRRADVDAEFAPLIASDNDVIRRFDATSTSAELPRIASSSSSSSSGLRFFRVSRAFFGGANDCGLLLLLLLPTVVVVTAIDDDSKRFGVLAAASDEVIDCASNATERAGMAASDCAR